MKKNQILTIVMYHYVRPIKNSDYPGIKGLELKGFKSQLDYLQENYSIINSEEVIEAVLKKKVYLKMLVGLLLMMVLKTI